MKRIETVLFGLLLLGISGCFGTSNERAIPNKDNSNYAGPNVGPQANNSSKPKQNLILPIPYTEKGARITVGAVIMFDGEFNYIDNFLPISPAYATIGAFRSYLEEDNQILTIESISTIPGSADTDKWQFYVSHYDEKKQEVTLDITDTYKAYEESIKDSPPMVVNYHMETGGTCDLTYSNATPTFELKDNLFFSKIERTVTTTKCGKGKKTMYYVFIPPISDGLTADYKQSKAGYETHELFFRSNIKILGVTQKKMIQAWNLWQPIEYSFSKNFPAKYRNNILEALKVFNDYFAKQGINPPGGDELFKILDNDQDYDPLSLSQNIIYWNEDIVLNHLDPQGAFTTYGAGSIFADQSSGFIFRSIISLNAASFALLLTFLEELAKTHTIDVDKIFNKEMKSIVIHEMGHSLGLRHNFHGCRYDRPSIMDYYNPGESPITLGKYDEEALLYGYKKTHNIKTGEVPYYCGDAVAPGKEVTDMMQFLVDCKKKLPADMPSKCRILPEHYELVSSLYSNLPKFRCQRGKINKAAKKESRELMRWLLL